MLNTRKCIKRSPKVTTGWIFERPHLANTTCLMLKRQCSTLDIKQKLMQRQCLRSLNLSKFLSHKSPATIIFAIYVPKICAWFPPSNKPPSTPSSPKYFRLPLVPFGSPFKTSSSRFEFHTGNSFGSIRPSFWGVVLQVLYKFLSSARTSTSYGNACQDPLPYNDTK